MRDSKIVSLKTHRRRKERADARAEADQNAAKFGRTRAERDLQARQQALDQARLDQHRLEDE